MMKKRHQTMLLAGLSAAPLSPVFAHAGTHALTTTEMISHVLASPFHMLAAIGLISVMSVLISLWIRLEKQKK